MYILHSSKIVYESRRENKREYIKKEWKMGHYIMIIIRRTA